tara:strand:- start:229 stop:732 length:504 start_codon:yes stop_codon:yes gene_type:complete
MKRSWLKPDWTTNMTINNIQIEHLLNKKIETVLLDVDGTLLPRSKKSPSNEVKTWINGAKKKLNLYLLSNNPSQRRIKEIAEILKLEYTHRAAKPFKKSTLKIIDRYNWEHSKIAIIGDRLFTDIILGNRLGIYTILVKSISFDNSINTNDNWQTLEKNLSKLIGVK